MHGNASKTTTTSYTVKATEDVALERNGRDATSNYNMEMRKLTAWRHQWRDFKVYICPQSPRVPTTRRRLTMIFSTTTRFASLPIYRPTDESPRSQWQVPTCATSNFKVGVQARLLTRSTTTACFGSPPLFQPTEESPYSRRQIRICFT